MIEDAVGLPSNTTLTAELVVVGAGPAGIVVALEAAALGVDVLLLESGGWKPDQRTQGLSRATIVDRATHAPVEIAVGRRVGGTSTMWGGRCVPYDRVDFEPRDIVTGSSWPVGYDDLEPYFARTCGWMICGRPAFTLDADGAPTGSMIEGFTDGDVLTSSLERWSLPTDFGASYAGRLRDQPHLRLVTSITCVGIELDQAGHEVARLRCRTLAGTDLTIEAGQYVLATGGLETTRLLLASRHPVTGKAVGDHSGHLGHWYMAHLEGVISDLHLEPASRPLVFGYERDVDGVYVRRRFTVDSDAQRRLGLPNIAGWVANPELSDARHEDAALSFTYLALISAFGHLFAPESQRLSLTGTRIPGAPYGTAERSPVWRHVLNLVRHPWATVRFAFGFGARRVLSRGRKPPGFFVHRPDGVYPFQYHAEHLPHYDSVVRLADDVDELGMRRLQVDIRFTADDLRGVVAAHQVWDRALRQAGVGRLIYHEGDLEQRVLARSGGGFHQIGTTRMARQAEDGVVDEHLRVHGVANLHVASSSAFVTSGQANSTFMIVAFALRLVEKLYGRDR